ncbi:MAG: hypothetical protein LBK77_01190 [Spirochaetaceae bacterium]|nr:hypothetical protein [Spirochaetaceae bacterium]
MGIAFLCAPKLFPADTPVAFIQDDSVLRISIKDSWLTESPARAAANRNFTYTLPGGGPVQVRSVRRGNELTVILARERNGEYPGWAQGSWVYTRNYTTGAPERIRIFLRSDPWLYVQLRPQGKDKSFMDVVLYEAYVIRGLSVGIPMDTLLTIPLHEALAAVGDRFPRRYFEPDIRLYRDTGTFTEKVRTALRGLNYEDDGALDETGRYVFIETLKPQQDPVGLNCSGFTKWLIDGMLRPVTGKRLAITPLKAPAAPRTSSLAENYENRDPLFGLDWTRNLALEAARALRSPDFAVLENVEVRQETFAALIDRSRGGTAIKSYPGFLLNAGFSMEGLRPLLYTLAVNEPGYLYLASISNERGPAPLQRQHYHEAVLVPYFNSYGVFQALVFESAAETTLDGLIRRHPGALINLVRVPIEGVFEP